MALSTDLFLMMVWSVPGAFMRILLGIYKVYITKGHIWLDWRRVILELLSAVAFGTFAAILLSDIGWIRTGSVLGPAGMALIGGFFGADLLNRLAHIVGVPEGISVAIERMPTNLNTRQQKALGYAGQTRSISNDEYQQVATVSDSTAQRELDDMVKKGYLKRVGRHRTTRYVF